MVDIQRPPMYQTYTPFVEFYINGVDILRSSDGKPRTLISFTHQRVEMTGGQWDLEVFDPDFVQIEEVLLGIQGKEGGTGGGYEGALRDYELMQPAIFRYGYVSQDGKVLVSNPEGEEFFFGSIYWFRPTFQPNGTLLHIHGDTAGFFGDRLQKAKRTFYGKNIFDVIKEVCEVKKWILVPLGCSSEVEELSPEKQPAALTLTSSSIDSTEELAPTFKMDEKETYFNFVCRLCNMARPNDPKYNGYACYLETRSSGIEGQPITYLYFGPKDVFLAPVRKYVYMRDKNSDVISFSPNLDVHVSQVSGVSGGLLMKADDNVRGWMYIHQFSEKNPDMHTLRLRRAVGTTISLPQMKQLQDGIAELGEESEKRPEGGSTDSSALVAPREADKDSPQAEESCHLTDQQLADHATMAWWLGMHDFVNSATLEIFGDPSPEILMGNNILVVYYVPAEDKEFRIHWVTRLWEIVGVVHTIQGGSFTTQLDLIAGSTPLSEVGTRQVWNALTDGMDENAMKKLGA